MVILSTVCAAVYLLGYCYRGPSAAKSAIKTASVAGLAAAAWGIGAPIGLVLALGFCALGDYLLARDRKTAFIAGVAAFACGHAAYTWLFLTHFHSQPERILGDGLIVVVLLLLIGGAMSIYLWRRAEDMRVPVVFYIPVIVAMGISATGLPGYGALELVLPAALLFILSDFVLALEKFGLPAGHPALRWTPFVVWACYWSAQLVFFAGLSGIPFS